MAGQTLNALQKGLYQKLNGNPPLMALIGKVYDAVPEHASYPYLAFDNIFSENIESVSSNRERIRMELQLYSKECGRKSLQTAMSSIHNVLHRAALSLETGFELYSLECGSAETQLLPDGTSWLGKVTLQAIVKKL